MFRLITTQQQVAVVQEPQEKALRVMEQMVEMVVMVLEL
jgi:hypothetical protein